jgi:dTDP-4-dehydrorhamnose 3,5-epimerase
MENKPELIQGGFFEDDRGRLDYVNGFNLDQIKRFYFITNTLVGFFRAWQGHKIERRWFYCVKGKFEVELVEIDDWENPSNDLVPIKFFLSAYDSKVLLIPPGYINGFKAIEEGSKLMVFSDFEVGVNKNDDVRFESGKWQ